MITIRLATIDDSEFLYSLSNDETVRKNSYSQYAFSRASHEEWYSNALNSSDYNIFIVVNKERNIGVVRFQLSEKTWVIGVSIKSESRGKGVGYKAIDLALQAHNSSGLVVAQIKKSNQASIRVFKKIGFKFATDKMIQGIASVELIWK